MPGTLQTCICLTSQARCDARLIFKQCKAGFNSEVFILKIGYPTRAKEPSLPNYLAIVGGSSRTDRFMCFPRVLV